MCSCHRRSYSRTSAYQADFAFTAKSPVSQPNKAAWKSRQRGQFVCTRSNSQRERIYADSVKRFEWWRVTACDFSHSFGGLDTIYTDYILPRSSCLSCSSEDVLLVFGRAVVWWRCFTGLTMGLSRLTVVWNWLKWCFVFWKLMMQFCWISLPAWGFLH